MTWGFDRRVTMVFDSSRNLRGEHGVASLGSRRTSCPTFGQLRAFHDVMDRLKNLMIDHAIVDVQCYQELIDGLVLRFCWHATISGLQGCGGSGAPQPEWRRGRVAEDQGRGTGPRGKPGARTSNRNQES